MTEVPVILDGDLGPGGKRLGPGLTETQNLRLSSVNKINTQKVVVFSFQNVDSVMCKSQTVWG